jgi:hypothetical protein
MEGRQPNRHGESLTPRQKRVLTAVGVLLIMLIAGAGAWAVTNPGSYGRSRDGCINVVIASSTGGAILHRCGDAARAMCRGAFSHHDRLAVLTQAQCRLAGLRPPAVPTATATG